MKMKIDVIDISASRTVPNAHILTMECGGYRYTGCFDNNLTDFMACVSEGFKYFAQAHGLLTRKEKS